MVYEYDIVNKMWKLNKSSRFKAVICNLTQTLLAIIYSFNYRKHLIIGTQMQSSYLFSYTKEK